MFWCVRIDGLAIADVRLMPIAAGLSVHQTMREHEPIYGSTLQAELARDLARCRILHRVDQTFDLLTDVVVNDGGPSHLALNRLTWPSIRFASSLRARFGSAVM